MFAAMETLLEAQMQSLAIVKSIDEAVVSQLVNFINPDFGLLDVLLSNGALTEEEATEVKSQGTVNERNEEVLKFVQQKGAVQSLATALLKTKQTHLVAYLANGGDYMSEFEDDWPLDKTQLHILDDNHSHLVILINPTEFAIQLLAKGVINVREKEIVLSKATDIEKNEALLDSLRRTSRRNYKKAIECLRETNQSHIANIFMQGGYEGTEENSETDFSDLPPVLYQLTLVKAYIHMTLIESQENRHPECGIYATLSAVNRNWHKIVHTKTFKDLLDYYFSAYFNGIMKRATVVSNNRYYLSLHVTPKGLIDKLHHAECLTDDDTRFIKCQTYDHDKIDETLSVVRDLSIKKYAVYVDCLRLTNQHLYADISETGGVTVKAKSINEETPNLEQLELNIVERLNHVRNKMMRRSRELERELDFLRQHDIEILNAYHDKGIVIWFWVHSQRSLEQMHEWRDADQVEKMFEKLFEVLGCWGEPCKGHIKPDFVIIEGSMFDREVVNLPMMLIMVSTLAIKIDRGPVQGVASLKNNLYVLHSKSILVYEIEKPFNCLDEIPATEFGSPVDMAACEISQCLYVTDAANSCVWKVTPADRKVEKWLSDVGAPFTSSVSRSGDVLILRNGMPSLLEVYRSDAGLLQKLQLPDGLENPQHAMETRSGNFNILYKQALIEMTKNGLVTREHKSFRESESLKAASHLALDIAERVYIAETNRIVHFDSQLVFERVVLPEDRVRGPQRLCLVREKKLLVVVHKSGSVVDVYNLRPRD